NWERLQLIMSHNIVPQGGRYKEPFRECMRRAACRGTMGRPVRAAPGGLAYHVLNRANGRQGLFDDDGDYAAFERLL
ncbi:MAG: hypothetical protein KGJ82_15765, partial [Nitrospirota bacterium]|nr:hypothetical protein [Nitrospirota bacterium]